VHIGGPFVVDFDWPLYSPEDPNGGQFHEISGFTHNLRFAKKGTDGGAARAYSATKIFDTAVLKGIFKRRWPRPVPASRPPPTSCHGQRQRKNKLAPLGRIGRIPCAGGERLDQSISTKDPWFCNSLSHRPRRRTRTKRPPCIVTPPGPPAVEIGREATAQARPEIIVTMIWHDKGDSKSPIDDQILVASADAIAKPLQMPEHQTK